MSSISVNQEIKRLQRRFNASLADGDLDLVTEAGFDLIRAIKNKPRPGRDDESRIRVIEGMMVLVKALEDVGKQGILEQMTPEERERLPFAMINEIVKMQKKRREH
ncbi:hypothetical protein [Bradyrhizobium sp. USDA 4508]